MYYRDECCYKLYIRKPQILNHASSRYVLQRRMLLQVIYQKTTDIKSRIKQICIIETNVATSYISENHRYQITHQVDMYYRDECCYKLYIRKLQILNHASSRYVLQRRMLLQVIYQKTTDIKSRIKQICIIETNVATSYISENYRY